MTAIDTLKLASDLRRDEGLRLKPYRCPAGRLTIGVGRNLDDAGISEEEAMILLGNDIRRFLDACREEPWWAAVADDDVRARAMVNMAFNLGMGGLRGFHNTLLYIGRKDWRAAATGVRNSLWYRQVGGRAERIARMIETGKDAL